jgi:dephospho-CoA kinase
MPLIIGLTGGIGCGKTSVSKRFSELGVCVIDTDQISRQMTQRGGASISEIRRDFGDSYITEEGSLDRERMRTLVFNDEPSRRRLESILHPLIQTEAFRIAASALPPYLIMVVPLLLETPGYRDRIDLVLTVGCDEQSQIERTMKRSGLSEQEVRSIMSAQITWQDRIQQSDDLIINNGDLAHLEDQVDSLHLKYLSLSNQG